MVRTQFLCFEINKVEIHTLICLLLGIGGWMHGHIPVAIFSIGASAILGWPFAGVIG